MDTKWIARSRRIWQWVSIVAVFLAGLDALTVDTFLPNFTALFGLSPEAAAVVRGKILALGGISALALKLWRVSRPDERSLTVIPAPLRDRLP